MKLAEALLRRKELNEKVSRIDKIRSSDIFEVRVERIKVTDNIDNVTAHVPKIDYNQVDGEFNYYSRQLRKIDALIQQANWTTEIDSKENLEADYVKA